MVNKNLINAFIDQLLDSTLVLEKMFFQRVDQLIIQWIENTELFRFSIENKYTNQSGEAFKHSSTYSRNLTCNYIISTIA